MLVIDACTDYSRLSIHMYTAGNYLCMTCLTVRLQLLIYISAMPPPLVHGIDQTSQWEAVTEVVGKLSHLSCLKSHHSPLTAVWL